MHDKFVLPLNVYFFDKVVIPLNELFSMFPTKKLSNLLFGVRKTI